MRKFLVVAMMMLVAGCASVGAASDAEVGAVYEALLEDECCVDHAIVQEVTDSVGLASAQSADGEDKGLRDFSPEIHEAMASLYTRSRTVQRLPDSLRVNGSDRRVPVDSVRPILARIQRRTPRPPPDSVAIVLISAVGFSRDGKVAVVRVTHICGYLCGSSTIRALRKHPGGWVPAERVSSVVS